ncbi:MAG TPA: DUF4352 domain-containing protein [Verrucomicrobiae bacterium]|nr:DUF4352 domain-containing protein [Verrucomicrobiae bacterium]
MSKQKDGNWFKRHKILTVIGALILLVIIVSAAGGNKTTNQTASSSSGSSKSSSSSNSSKAAAVGLNQPANDGKFQFTVTGIQCQQTQVESPVSSFSDTTAGAPYCFVSMTVKNISNVAQSFDPSAQYIYDATGKQYSYDSAASIDIEPQSSNFVDYPSLNPGTSVSGQLVFDIPNTITPTYATLHDSSLSSGVKVNLQ